MTTSPLDDSGSYGEALGEIAIVTQHVVVLEEIIRAAVERLESLFGAVEVTLWVGTELLRRLVQAHFDLRTGREKRETGVRGTDEARKRRTTIIMPSIPHHIRFHGVLAPNARLRAEIIPSGPVNANNTPMITAPHPITRRLLA